MQDTSTISSAILRVELARRGLTQTDLAERLGVPGTTLSSWLKHRHPQPQDLSERINKVLDAAEVIDTE